MDRGICSGELKHWNAMHDPLTSLEHKQRLQERIAMENYNKIYPKWFRLRHDLPLKGYIDLDILKAKGLG